MQLLTPSVSSMDKILLKCITILYPVLARIGVDTDQLNQILKIKLLMDSRRPIGLFAGKGNVKPATEGKTPWVTTIFTFMLGVFLGIILFLNEMPYVGQTLYFFIFMVLMSLTLISDFTTVLIDVRDHYILLPRPVNDRTIATSRILHISIYVLRLALLQGVPGLIMIGYIDGLPAVPLFFLQILEATFLSVLLVNIVYLVLMKVVSPQKFKDIISYFQIAFSVSIFAAYYLLPKLISVSALEEISLLDHWWAYFLPPLWIAALNELLIHSVRANLVTGILALVGLILPIVGMWLVVKVLAPGFNKRLAVLATSEGNSDSKVNKAQAGKFDLIDKVSNWLVPDLVENAGFRITLKLASRTRDFKMKVYPALAYVPIYFLAFAFRGGANGAAGWLAKLQTGHSYVFLIYTCIIVLLTVLTNITMSEKYKASWVYFALPIGEPGKILSGMYKSIVSFYFFPYCLVISIVTVAIWGPQAINDLILAFLMCVIFGMIIALFLVRELPFTKPVLTAQGGGKFINTLVVFIIGSAVGFAHYYAMKWEMLISIMIIPAVLINLLMFHYYKKQTWANIEMSEV
jgi:ABC-2 type transport system permease protein